MVKRDNEYICDLCGLTVTVDEVYGCNDTHELVCCGEPMKSDDK